jgi:hypothetical protein
MPISRFEYILLLFLVHFQGTRYTRASSNLFAFFLPARDIPSAVIVMHLYFQKINRLNIMVRLRMIYQQAFKASLSSFWLSDCSSVRAHSYALLINLLGSSC